MREATECNSLFQDNIKDHTPSVWVAWQLNNIHMVFQENWFRKQFKNHENKMQERMIMLLLHVICSNLRIYVNKVVMQAPSNEFIVHFRTEWLNACGLACQHALDKDNVQFA